MTSDKRIQDFLPLTPLWFQILAVLGEGDRHGYGIITELRSRVEGFNSASGPVYLALRRMRQEGLLEEVEAPKDADKRRRHYRITELGRKVAREDAVRLSRLFGLAVDTRLILSDRD